MKRKEIVPGWGGGGDGHAYLERSSLVFANVSFVLIAKNSKVRSFDLNLKVKSFDLNSKVKSFDLNY